MTVYKSKSGIVSGILITVLWIPLLIILIIAAVNDSLYYLYFCFIPILGIVSGLIFLINYLRMPRILFKQDENEIIIYPNTKKEKSIPFKDIIKIKVNYARLNVFGQIIIYICEKSYSLKIISDVHDVFLALEELLKPYNFKKEKKFYSWIIFR